MFEVTRFNRLEDDFAINKKKKTVFLHIGMPKTGSTAIQIFSEKNRAHLRKRGVLYPCSGNVFSGHHSLPISMRCTNSEYGRVDYIIHYLRCEIASFTGDTIVLSSEHFYGDDLYENKSYIRFIEWLNKSYELKVVMYFREQNDFLSSLYNQMVKHDGFSQSFSEMVEDNHYRQLSNVMREYNRLSSLILPAQIILRCFKRDYLVNSDVVDDFFSIVGVDISMLEPEVEHNQSLNNDEAQFCRIINALGLNFNQGERFRKYFVILAGGICRDRVDISAINNSKLHCEALTEYFLDSNSSIEKQFLNSVEYFKRPGLQSSFFGEIPSPENFIVYLNFVFNRSDLTPQEFVSACNSFLSKSSSSCPHDVKRLLEVVVNRLKLRL